jgi:long-subunit fatty acid transport protein
LVSRVSSQVRQLLGAAVAGGLLAAPALTAAAPYDLVTTDGPQFVLGVRAWQEDQAPGLGSGRYGIGFAGNVDAWRGSYDNWLGRPGAEYGGPALMSLTPGLAYRPSTGLALGAALDLRYRLSSNAATGAPAFRDGRLGAESGLRGVGLNLDMRYALDPRTDLGLAYRSQFRQDTYTTGYPIAHYTDLESGVIALPGIAVPQAVSASIQRQVGERWALTGALGWQEWAPDADVLGTRAPSLGSRGDTWFAGVGAQYRLRENLGVGMAVEYFYGNGLDAARRNLTRSDALGGDAAGNYFFGLDLRWKF